MKRSDEIKRGLECLVCYGLGCDGECDTCSKNTNHMEQEDLMQATLDYIQQLEEENKQLKSANIVLTAKAALTDEAVEAGAKAQKELEQLKRERDALRTDILRATDKAEEMQSVLDDEAHPNCDYALYLTLCDALGDVVAWEHGELLNNEVNEYENT